MSRYLRAVIFGALAISAAACDKGASSGTPAVVAGATAGKVVELAGKVTATRDGKTRDLTVGAEVSGDDVIETTADGKVAIDLAHNNARWSLGGGKKIKVSESAAWTLAKADKPAEAVGGESSAAGRHAERSSTDTAVSAAASAPANEGAVAPPPEEATGGAPSGAPMPPPAPTTAAKPPPPPPPRADRPAASKPSPPPSPKTDEIADLLDGNTKADKPSPPGINPPRAPVPGSPEPTVDSSKLKADLQRARGAMTKCLPEGTGTVKLKMSCDTGKACWLSDAATLDDKTKQCVGAEMAKIKVDGKVTVMVPLTR